MANFSEPWPICLRPLLEAAAEVLTFLGPDLETMELSNLKLLVETLFFLKIVEEIPIKALENCAFLMEFFVKTVSRFLVG